MFLECIRKSLSVNAFFFNFNLGDFFFHSWTKIIVIILVRKSFPMHLTSNRVRLIKERVIRVK